MHNSSYNELMAMIDLHKILVEESPVFISTIDKNGRILHMNKIMLDFFGYAQEEVLGEDYLTKFLPPSEHHKNAPFFKRNGISQNYVMAKNKKRYLIEWHGRCIYDDNGEFVFSFGFGIDITEKYKTAQQLRKAFTEIEILKNKLETENSALKQRIKISSFNKIVGESDNIKECMQRITMLAQTNSTVLVLGETGTGKELVAEAIHNASGRSSKPLIKVNCPAIPETLFESELFGHVQGAFSGAVSNKEGRVAAAESGTLLLDEIAEIPVSIQVKLLRFLESKEYERVGETKTRKSNVKIIASTNANLDELVKAGKFRSDLLFRLRVGTLTLPPLRERKNDIHLLMNDFLQYYNNMFNKKVLFPNAAVLNYLLNYDWPGNIRELKHVMEHACIYCQDVRIEMSHLPDYITAKPAFEAGHGKHNMKVDESALLNALEQCRWNKQKAAKLLGVHRCTLYRLINKYELEV